MKKLSIMLALVLALGCLPVFASAESVYQEAPMLAERVASGELPPVEERLPLAPEISNDISEEYLDFAAGNYGGTLRFVTSVVNWDADVFIGNNEGLLTMQNHNDAIVSNICTCEPNEDYTEFTFTLLEGIKWSDGTPVTSEDFAFTWNNYVLNAELTPAISKYHCDGGSTEGDPLTFEVIDENTVRYTSKTKYGGFMVYCAITNYCGYTDLLKPAHFLKQFHKDYAEEVHGSLDAYYEFLAPFAAVMGYDDPAAESVWKFVFDQVDMTNWELTDPNDALTSVFFSGLIDENMPVLYAWQMLSSANGLTTWERNPYYWKVDPYGNQLPYLDYITSTLVENMELVQFKIMAGEVDFSRESASIDNITLYKENEEASGYTTHLANLVVTPVDFHFNMNYDDEAWQEVNADIRFRQALALAVDCEEILETIYNNFGSPSKQEYVARFDLDEAAALLDEMGMIDADGDGWRETPSGLPFSFVMYNSKQGSDQVPVAELILEYWHDLGINCDLQVTESSLLSTKIKANEVAMSIAWLALDQCWFFGGWATGTWAPLWDTWWLNGGLNAEPGADIQGEEPPEEVKELYRKIEALLTESPEDAVQIVIPEIMQMYSDNLWLIYPVTEAKQCIIINSDIGNVPTSPVATGWNYSIENFYFKTAK